jgi:hypothetical protein
MTDISLRTAWEEGLALARTHRWVLLLYAILGAAIPFLLLESEPIFNLRTIVAIVEAPWAAYVGGSIKGPLYLLAIVTVLATGCLLAAQNAMLTDIREGVSSEIMFGLVAGAAYLITVLIFYIVIGLLMTLPFFLIFGGDGMIALPGWVQVVRQILTLVVSSWLSARFCLVGPVMAARSSLEPVSAWFESWRRTHRAQLRLFFFYMGFNIVVGVLIGAFAALHIYVIMDNAQNMDTPQETAMSVGWALLWMLLFLLYALIPAGLYRASEPGASGDVFE